MKRKREFLNLISVIALFFNYQLFYQNGLIGIFNDKYLLLRFLLMGLFYAFLYFLPCHMNNKTTRYQKLLSIVFSLFLFIGSSYRLFNTITTAFSLKMILPSIVMIVGYYNLILIFFSYLCLFLNIKLNNKKNNKFIELFNKKTFLVSLIIIIMSWAIYYVAYYPIVLSPDPSYQIKQALGERTKYSDYSIQLDPNVNITNHHPVAHTLLLGSFVKIGKQIGNDNFGLFLYSLIQGLFLAGTLAYSISFLKKKKTSNRYLFLMLALYSLAPMFPLYALNANKDVYYTIFIMWLLMLIFALVDDDEKLSLKKSLVWILVMVLICLFRHNGIYLITFLIPFLIVYNNSNFKYFSIIYIIVFLLFFSYKNILLPKFKITDTSPREKMSIFFQQTARYVINHEEQMSDDDKKIIAKVIDYDAIKTNYNPILADPIKNTFNKYATKNDINNYYKLWFKEFLNHPITYVDATLHNTYGYFDPGSISWYVYTNYDARVTQNNLVNYHFNNLTFLRKSLKIYSSIFLFIPIIGLVSNIGFSSWLIMAFAIWLIKKDKQKYLTFLVPLLTSMIICVASPVNTYFRYAMPFVFSNLFVIGIWLLIRKRTNG